MSRLAGRLFRQTAKISKGIATGLTVGFLISVYHAAKEHGLVSAAKSQLGI